MRWLIYIGSREMARVHGDPLLGVVEAPSRSDALTAAAAQRWVGKGQETPFGAGYWAVMECPPEVRILCGDGGVLEGWNRTTDGTIGQP